MSQHGYIINQEREDEMLRLNKQARIVTEAMGGVLPELTCDEIMHLHDVLGLACGPGEWLMALTRSCHHIHATGVDISKRMIAYANAQKENKRVTFRVMDILKHPLDFPDASFDLINMRMIIGFMRRESWPLLLAECFRLLRPGGIVRITEPEATWTHDAVYQRFLDICWLAFQKAGMSFAPTPSHSGITVVLKRMMLQSGFQDVHVRPISIDLCHDSEMHEDLMEDSIEVMSLASQFLIKYGNTTQEEIESIREELRNRLGKNSFGDTYWIFQTVWAKKP